MIVNKDAAFIRQVQVNNSDTFDLFLRTVQSRRIHSYDSNLYIAIFIWMEIIWPVNKKKRNYLYKTELQGKTDCVVKKKVVAEASFFIFKSNL